MSNLYFAPVTFDHYDRAETLPVRFEKICDKINNSDFGKIMNGKSVAIKMHVGRGIGYTTIHPLFVKTLVDKVKEAGGKPFICDQTIEGARARGYTEDFLGCPIFYVCAGTGKYFYPIDVDFKTFKHVDVGGYIYDTPVMIDLSHVKGHGECGLGGACKNIAMGAVTDRTRGEIHGLEGNIVYHADKCTHCEACIRSCNHDANSFDKDGNYKVFFHHCTNCGHCVKVCPTGAIDLLDSCYEDFHKGMAICTKTVLDTFDPGHVYYINFLTNITAICDCWGLSTPSIVPDIGVLAGSDMVAIENATLDLIKYENVLTSGIPSHIDLSAGEGHLLQRLHSRDPYDQLTKLEEQGVGNRAYTLTEVK